LARGREEGVKDRPSLVLALSVKDNGRTIETMVVAMTHTPLARATDGVAVPTDVKRRLGLDDEQTWVVTTEANVFVWPGPDLRPIPGRRPVTAMYGRVPESFLSKVAQSYLANRTRQRRRLVTRTE
ncbi:MAG TPA: hypothetical protein VHW90_02215, partial [Stellaceae bacterium]|nr:hypothetical protein [Stellaceae bacterium]